MKKLFAALITAALFLTYTALTACGKKNEGTKRDNIDGLVDELRSMANNKQKSQSEKVSELENKLESIADAVLEKRYSTGESDESYSDEEGVNDAEESESESESEAEDEPENAE